MPINTDAVRARLNLGHIDTQAMHCALDLSEHGVGMAMISPGDATYYPFIVTDRAFNPLRGGRYCVTLASTFGASYPWNGQRMDPSYCGDKWAHEHRDWTGVVVAEFLNALSKHLSPHPQGE